jgi:hypothetical protein
MFLLSTEPRRDSFRVARHTVSEIAEKVSVDHDMVHKALIYLYGKWYVGNSSKGIFYIEREGKEQAKILIRSMTDYLSDDSEV